MNKLIKNLKRSHSVNMNGFECFYERQGKLSPVPRIRRNG